MAQPITITTATLNDVALEACRLVVSGSSMERASFEADYGASLSTIIDDCWEWADSLGRAAVVNRCAYAYRKLTGT